MDKDREYSKKLVGYVDIHKDTPRALILINNLAQLAYQKIRMRCLKQSFKKKALVCKQKKMA